MGEKAAPGGTDGISCGPRGFLQAPWWGEFKSRFGWKSRVVDYGEGEGALVLSKRLAKLFSFAYVPHGPVASSEDRVDALVACANAIAADADPSCVFIRFDPPWYLTRREGEPFERPLIGKPFVKANADIQPPDTVLIDLALDEDALLAGMKPKWRYNVKLAEKKSVTVRWVCARDAASEAELGEAIARFYELYRTTSERDRIAIHPERYYRELFSIARESGVDLRIWLAEHEGTLLAAIITLYSGATATYLYGASSNEKRNLMPAYALQWAAIREAKASGCAEYDFYGMPPTDDPNHPMHGLYKFKTGFGGAIIHRPGSYDYVLKPVTYALFRLAEGARLFFYKRVKKSLGRKGEPKKSGQKEE